MKSFLRYRVEWGKMSMVGQREPDDIFAPEEKAKELMITGSSMLFFLFQWKNKNVDLFTMGSLIFGIQNKIPSDHTYFVPTYPRHVPNLGFISTNRNYFRVLTKT